MPSTGVAAGRLTSSPRLRTLSSLLAGLVTVLWAASLVPLIGVGSSNVRLVEAFATDEAMQLGQTLLHGAAAKHTFGLTFGPYGHLVFNVILVTLRLMPGELTDARIVQTGRAILPLLFRRGHAVADVHLDPACLRHRGRLDRARRAGRQPDALQLGRRLEAGHGAAVLPHAGAGVDLPNGR